MAKRRKLEAPTADDLSRIEEEFRRETQGRKSAMAPISQVAAEAAEAHEVAPAQQRAKQAKDSADAERLRRAQEQGLVMLELPVGAIEADAMVRDRTVIDPEEMTELQTSIAANGLRLPIEVYLLDAGADAGDTPRYGLLSGYRRLMAVRNLRALTEQGKYDTIKAVLRDPDAMGGAFAAMVEENEVRASLSQFERGRIAVIAAQQGAFANTEEAVNALFPAASKAKRSKIRSFALIFEELGDMLRFPEALKEREGLRVAAALRIGAEARLREVLASEAGETPDLEWDLIAAALAEFEAKDKDRSRGGRPKTALPKPGWQGADTLRLSSGVTLRKQADSRGYLIRLEGKPVNADLVDMIMVELQNLLEKP